MAEEYRMVARNPGGREVLAKQALEIGAPATDELIVQHTAIGLNFVDIYFRSGLYPWPVDKDHVLGCEAAGTVTAMGDDVDGFKTGDRVAYVVGSGAYQTQRALPASMAVHIPDGVSDEIAAASMLKGLTCHYLLFHSYPVQNGETVLFHAAAGGVGLIAGQWLKHLGVTAIGTAGGPEKCALARENGFDHVIDYKSEDFVDRVMDITAGKGVTAVYDSVGHDTLSNSLKCLQKFGTLVSFGQASGPALDFKINDLAPGSLRLTRPTLFAFTSDRKWLEKASSDLFGLIENGTIKISINQEFPLERVADAHDALENRRTVGCTLLKP